MTLYDINREIYDLFDTAADDDGNLTGEAFERLQTLNKSRDEKIENCALLIKEWLAEATKIKNEADALTKRRRALENKAEGLKAYLSNQIMGERFETPRVAIRWIKSHPAKIIDESLIPNEFWKPQAPVLDKNGINKALNSGQTVPGAIRDEKYNMQIK